MKENRMNTNIDHVLGSIDAMLEEMNRTFSQLERSLPNKPQLIHQSGYRVWRFIEKDLYQALFLKTARSQSLIRSARLLYDHRFLQELSILQRPIDETNEDMSFLALGCINGISDLHNRFMEAFWLEEIDETGVVSTLGKKLPRILRKDIQAYLAGCQDTEKLKQLTRDSLGTLYKNYSGHVHGASVYIMEMYCGDPPHFHTNGIREEEHESVHVNILYSYTLRCFDVLWFVSLAFNVKGYGEFNVESLREQSNIYHQYHQRILQKQ